MTPFRIILTLISITVIKSVCATCEPGPGGSTGPIGSPEPKPKYKWSMADKNGGITGNFGYQGNVGNLGSQGNPGRLGNLGNARMDYVDVSKTNTIGYFFMPVIFYACAISFIFSAYYGFSVLYCNILFYLEYGREQGNVVKKPRSSKSLNGSRSGGKRLATPGWAVSINRNTLSKMDPSDRCCMVCLLDEVETNEKVYRLRCNCKPTIHVSCWKQNIESANGENLCRICGSVPSRFIRRRRK